jgi:hypothetical protein
MIVFQKCHLGLGENRTQVLLHRNRVCYRVRQSEFAVINYFLYFQLKCSLWALAFTLIIAPILANNDSDIIETARNGKGKIFAPLFFYLSFCLCHYSVSLSFCLFLCLFSASLFLCLYSVSVSFFQPLCHLIFFSVFLLVYLCVVLIASLSPYLFSVLLSFYPSTFQIFSLFVSLSINLFVSYCLCSSVFPSFPCLYVLLYLSLSCLTLSLSFLSLSLFV